MHVAHSPVVAGSPVEISTVTQIPLQRGPTRQQRDGATNSEIIILMIQQHFYVWEKNVAHHLSQKKL